MPVSLVIDTAGGANFAGFHVRNMASLHVGGSGLASGVALQVTGDMSISGTLEVTGVVMLPSSLTIGAGAIASGHVLAVHATASTLGIKISRSDVATYWTIGRGSNYLGVFGPSSSTVRFKVQDDGHISIPTTARFYFDDGGDTYIVESAANNLRFFVGGANAVEMHTSGIFAYLNVLPAGAGSPTIGASGTRWANVFSVLGNFSGAVSIAATQRLYLDGGGDTYISEAAADQIHLTVGGVTPYLFATTIFRPTTNDSIQLGGAAQRWSVVRSVLGDFSGLLTAGAGLLVQGGAAGAGRLWVSAANGLHIRGVTGSSYDFQLERPDGTMFMRVPTGTLDVTFAGLVRISNVASLLINGVAVSFGANDSGGAGFKVLRVPN